MTFKLMSSFPVRRWESHHYFLNSLPCKSAKCNGFPSSGALKLCEASATYWLSRNFICFSTCFILVRLHLLTVTAELPDISGRYK